VHIASSVAGRNRRASAARHAARGSVRGAGLIDVAIDRRHAAGAGTLAARLAALAAGFACFLRRELVRVAAGVCRSAACTGDLPLLVRVHSGKSASPSGVVLVALVLVAMGHGVLLFG
jgi:hypothetical protein